MTTLWQPGICGMYLMLQLLSDVANGWYVFVSDSFKTSLQVCQPCGMYVVVGVLTREMVQERKGGMREKGEAEVQKEGEWGGCVRGEWRGMLVGQRKCVCVCACV